MKKVFYRKVYIFLSPKGNLSGLPGLAQGERVHNPGFAARKKSRATNPGFCTRMFPGSDQGCSGGAQGVPRGADEASPRGEAGRYPGTPMDALDR